MSKTLSTGYALKTNGQTVNIDLTSATHWISGRVRWKGIDSSFVAYNVNSTTYPPSVSTSYPYKPTGYTDFMYHYHYGWVECENTHPTESIDVRYVLASSGGSYYGSYITLSPGQKSGKMYVSRYEYVNYSGNSTSLGTSTNPSGLSGYIVTTISYSVYTYASKTVKTTNPSITKDGTIVQYTGEVTQGAETDWHNITFALTPGEVNVITCGFDLSTKGYAEIEYTYEPKLPIPEDQSPEYGHRTTDTEIVFEFEATEDVENSAVKYHARIELDDNSVMQDADIYESKESQSGWEYWTGAAWAAFPAGGVDPNTLIRYTKELALGTHYYRASLWDGYGYGLVGTANKLRVLVTVSGLYVLDIDGTEYDALSLAVVEASNGEIGQIVAVLDNQDGTTYSAIDFGDTVTVAFNDSSGNIEEFTGVVRDKKPSGIDLEIYAILGDGILAERIIKEDYGSQDIGQTVADIISDYCAPLTYTNVNTSTGFTVSLSTNGKTPLAVLEELRKNYSIFYYVDKDWDLHFYLPAAISEDASMMIKYGE